MLKRQTEGSIVCPSCGKLVGVNDAECWSCGRRNPGLWGFAPLLRGLGQDLGFTRLVIGGSVLLYVVMLVADMQHVSLRGFGFLGPSGKMAFLFGASGWKPVVELGRWWTLLSAGWLHGGLLHILFNMMWVRQLAPATAALYGPGRAMTIYTAGGIVGFLMSSLAPFFPGFLRLVLGGGGGFTLGASAPLFGLLGALIYGARRTGRSLLGQQIWTWAIGLFVFGLVMPGVDNWAHLGGFLGGYGVARVLDPLLPERADHLLIGLSCLVATALAIVASVLTGLRFV